MTGTTRKQAQKEVDEFFENIGIPILDKPKKKGENK